MNNVYENIENNSSSRTEIFLEKERENHYDVPKSIKTEYEDQQQNITHIPDVTFQMTTPEEDKQQLKSVKDRMLLSTDDTSCLLFTQTITSPMLTPSEENIDFLKGFQREPEEILSPSAQNDVVDKVEIEFAKAFTEPIYENLDGFKMDEINDEHIYENIEDLNQNVDNEILTSNQMVKDLRTKFSSDEQEKKTIVSKETAELDELKTLDVTKQIISKFEENTNAANINSVVVVVSVHCYILQHVSHGFRLFFHFFFKYFVQNSLFLM